MRAMILSWLLASPAIGQTGSATASRRGRSPTEHGLTPRAPSGSGG
jgi:hypothetical protein